MYLYYTIPGKNASKIFFHFFFFAKAPHLTCLEMDTDAPMWDNI